MKKPDWAKINYDTETITVDGISCSRQIFKWFADGANLGRHFKYINKDDRGVITIETLPEPPGKE